MRTSVQSSRRTVQAVVVALLLGAGCGGSDDADRTDRPRPTSTDPGPIHVHGLGVNPRDGALFIATHTGLFRVPPGESKASRVGDRWQDTMGFTVVGPDHFLGSGHPDGRDNLPPFLGLIESVDAGKSWRPVSLLGKSDFHVLEARGRQVYGFGSSWETRKQQFLVSSDGGKTWDERRVPEPLISLAVHPRTSDRVVASSESAIYESRDGGMTWRGRASEAGLLAWRSPTELILIRADGSVKESADGLDWRIVGNLGREPAAFEAERDGLYAALHDGTIERSSDGGSSWTVYSRP